MKIHMVKQGDSMYTIAKKYNVSLEELIKANPEVSNPDNIAIGLKVKIPVQPKSTLEIIHHHVVQQGDSMWKLSKSWGIQLADMIKANPQVKNPNALLTGEVVNIPKTPLTEVKNTDDHDSMSNVMPNSGKADTGTQVLPSTGKQNTAIKPDTSVKPVPEAPPVMPTLPPVPQHKPTMPAPMPMPVMPAIEKKPVYGGIPDHIDLFKQYPVPAVQATSPVMNTYNQNAVPYGYGSQQNVANQQAMTSTGYGYGYGQGMTQGVAQGMPQGMPQGMGYGMSYGMTQGIDNCYGYPQGLSPTQGHPPSGLAGVYEQYDYSGYGNYSPVAGYGSYSPAAGYGSYNPTAVQGVMAPSSVTKPSGCKSCGGNSNPAWTTNMNTYGGMLAPQASHQGMEYGYGNMSQEYQPYGSYANVNSYPMGYAGYGPQGMESYYGGTAPIPSLPAIPALPPLPPMPSLAPLSVAGQDWDDRISDTEEESVAIASNAKNRTMKKKSKKISAAAPKRIKNKENLPWIKW